MDEALKVLAALSMFALIAFITFKNKDLLKSPDRTEPGIKKVFYLLIIAVPALLLFLYYAKVKDSAPSKDDYLLKGSKSEISI